MAIERKFGGGFKEDRSNIYTFILEWDENGRYTGQWQDNAIDEGLIFIGAPTGFDARRVPVADLTEEEMRSAKAEGRS